MSEVNRDLHWPWLGFALEEGVRLGVTDAQELMGYATPEILVAQLPSDVTTLLIARALESGSMSPTAVLETAPPALLAEHLEPEVLWRLLSDAAARHQLTLRGGHGTSEGKQWIALILQHALDSKLVTPPDVLRFVPPAEFVRHTPLPVMAEMIRTGLTNGKFDPVVVLQHLTPKVIAEHLEVALAWACIADAVERGFELESSAQPRGAEPMEKAEKAEKHDKADKAEKAEKADKAEKHAKPHKEVAGSAKIDAVTVRRVPAPPQRTDVTAWSASDDLEVLEEQPLPPPPAPVAQKR